MRLWINNTDGQPDAVLTMTLMGFLAILGKFLLSNVSLTLASDHIINFGSVDAMSIAAVLTPTLGAYCARRYTDKKFGADGIQGTADDEVEPGVAQESKKGE